MLANERRLLAELEAAPDDEGLRLVYADCLTARERWWGELIVLDAMDRAVPGGLADVFPLKRLLVLAAREGFPRFGYPDAPLRAIRAHRPDSYEGYRDGLTYRIRYDGFGVIAVFVEDGQRRTNEHAQLRLEGAGDLLLTDEETTVVLHAVDAAIRDDVPLRRIALPSGAALRNHPHHRLGPYPRYALPAEVTHGQDITLGARDYHRWLALYQRYCRLNGSRTLGAA